MSEPLPFDPWTPLSNGDADPLCRETEPFCEELAPCRSFVCTRENGHEGLHVASYSRSQVCCDAWGLTLQQCLPEGF